MRPDMDKGGSAPVPACAETPPEYFGNIEAAWSLRLQCSINTQSGRCRTRDGRKRSTAA